MKTVFLLSILTALTLSVSATIVRRQTGSCSGQQVNSFLANLPQVCQDAIRAFTVNDLRTICTRDCYGVFTQFVEETCNSPFLARVNRAQCSRGDATVDYCYPIVINQTLYNATRALLNSCGNPNTTCTPSCPEALRTLAASVGCCWAELIYVNPDTTVTYTTAAEWASCGVPFPGECANPFTTEGFTTSSIATAIAFTAGTVPPTVSTIDTDTTSTIGTVATAGAQALLMTKILAAIISYMFHCIMISYTELL